mmetsp:Transcript_10766/g.24583  ORF Transcript_10766/g.24583 Transcript_10766/m.24583 type:complete len:243 (+) Transcript_10766:1167-1895(+)
MLILLERSRQNHLEKLLSPSLQHLLKCGKAGLVASGQDWTPAWTIAVLHVVHLPIRRLLRLHPIHHQTHSLLAVSELDGYVQRQRYLHAHPPTASSVGPQPVGSLAKSLCGHITPYLIITSTFRQEVTLVCPIVFLTPVEDRLNDLARILILQGDMNRELALALGERLPDCLRVHFNQLQDHVLGSPHITVRLWVFYDFAILAHGSGAVRIDALLQRSMQRNRKVVVLLFCCFRSERQQLQY